jgi:hypothetical protein
MTKVFKSLVVVGFFLITAPMSQAAAKFGVAGAVDYNLFKQTVASVETKGGLGFGGGLVVDIGPIGVSAIYISRKTTATTTLLGVSVDVSANTGIIHVPVVYRIGLGGASLNLGGFYGIGTASGSGSDYGATGGFRFGKKFFVDLSYNMGLKDNSGTKSKAALALIGTMF